MDKVGNILDMTGRVALITGAGQGVGRQVALHLASFGASVAVNDFHLERAEAVVDEIRSFGGTALAVQADVSDFDEVGSMVGKVNDVLGTVDTLVNNAGNAGPAEPGDVAMKPFWETTPTDWQRWLGVNLYGVMNCTRHVLSGMREKGSGTIVSVVSEASRYGDANMEAYAGGKAAAAGIMRSVARGMARYGIRANSVAIAATRTPATEEHFADDEVMKKQLRLYPLRRVGEPNDVANVVLFLSSDASSYVTGQVYAVNGGFVFGL